MISTTKPCPLCGKPLSREEYLKITGHWDELQQIKADFRSRLRSGIDKARRSERNRVSHDVIMLRGKVVALRGRLRQMKERSERGLTPQLEGLLYEKELGRQLSARFRQDKIVPAGKGGDIIHHVHLNGTRIGTIVYECKKVGKLQKAHVEQTRLAMIQRGADFAILVTSAKASNTFGFWFEKDILVIHPAGVLALTRWLRDSLLELAKARMPKNEREKAVREVLDFLAGPIFKNAMQDMVRRAEALGKDLKDEVRSHQSVWARRFEHYRGIWLNACSVTRKVIELIESHNSSTNPKMLPDSTREAQQVYPFDKAELLSAT